MNLVLIKQPRVYPRRLFYQISKRLTDLAICILALPVIIPIMILCAIAIYFDSPGSIFFVQERIGKGDRRFRMIKFRTMYTNLDDSQGRAFMKAYIRGELGKDADGKKSFKPFQTGQITRVGRILRKTSLDELPQIFNVLRGEMSIVGPRPNVPWEVEEYRPWHYERMEVLPGITGLAQVHGRSCINFDTIARNDIEYIEKRCLWLDIKIIWWTLTAIIRAKGAM